jgi:hypothetical protein
LSIHEAFRSHEKLMLWLLPGVALAGAALIVPIGWILAHASRQGRGAALGGRPNRRGVARPSAAGLYGHFARPFWLTWVSDRPRLPLAAAAAAPALITLALALVAGVAGWTARYDWSPAFVLEAELTRSTAIAAAVVPGAALVLLVYAALRAPRQAMLPFVAASTGCMGSVELLAVAADWLTRLLGCELAAAGAWGLWIAVRRWRRLRFSPRSAEPNGLEVESSPTSFPRKIEIAERFGLSAGAAIRAFSGYAARLDERILDGPVGSVAAALELASSKADLTEAAIDRCTRRPALWAKRAGAGLARLDDAVGHSLYTAGVLTAAALAYTAILLLLIFST